MRKNNFLIVVVVCLFLLNGLYAVIPQTLNLQGKLTNSSDDALTGTYNMTFRIYDVVTGGSALWISANNSITTDGDGIYNFVLNNVNLSFDQEYYVGIKVESDAEMTPRINLTSTPYTFRTQNISADGIINDSNLNLVGKDITASSGLFSWLGSLLNRITTLFVQDIDFTGTINGSGNISTTGNITADYYYGDGSKLTNLPSGGNMSWNESLAWTLFAPNTTVGIQHLINDTGIYETYNATYDDYALNVSRNWTAMAFDAWGSNWYNHTLSTFNTWNSTWDESGWVTDTFVPYTGATKNINLGIYNLSTSGRVGIGTTTPSQMLDVRGQGNFSGTIYINNATDISTWEANVSKNYTLDTYTNWNDVWTTTYNATYVAINTTANIQGLLNATGIYETYNTTYNSYAYNVSLNYTQRVYDNWDSRWFVLDGTLNSSAWNRTGTDVFLHSTGDSVGIGTDNPSHKLQVIGNISAENFNATGPNTFVGTLAGYSNSGSKVTAIGYQAGDSNTDDYVTVVGYQTGKSNAGDRLTAVGYASGVSNTGNFSTFIGFGAGNSNIGDDVTGLGYYAGYQSKGNKTTVVGYYSGEGNTGDRLTALGYKAGLDNAGNVPILIGENSGYLNNGNYFISIGYQAGISNKGNRSIGIGYEALASNTKNNVVAIGYEAGENNAVPDQFIVKHGLANAVPLIQGNFSSGFLGIGTIAPSQMLDVRGQGNFSGTIFINNATDISTWESNVSRNWTLDAFNTWGSNWYNHTLSTFNTWGENWYNHTSSVFTTWNSTWDESGWATDTFLSIANSGWNRSGTNVFLGYTGDSVGIGTDNPTHKLNVVGTFNTTSAGSSLIMDANGNIKIGI